eukprot:jgi/Tetstr1/459245/TSEL_000054.t1
MAYINIDIDIDIYIDIHIDIYIDIAIDTDINTDIATVIDIAAEIYIDANICLCINIDIYFIAMDIDICTNTNIDIYIRIHISIDTGIDIHIYYIDIDIGRLSYLHVIYLLQVIKTAPGAAMVSSAFFMLLEQGAKVFADCAIVEDPTAEQLAEIGAASAVTAASFGLIPRVAMLSYATGDSNTGPMTSKVRRATELLKQHPAILARGIPVEGPIQFDAAVDPEIAAVKYKGDPGQVAGRANVCIFPDLNAGNNAYKAVQQSSGCLAVGPLMQGLRMPVNDLSRGCTVDDIVSTVAMTCVQAITAKAAAAASKPAPQRA